MFKPAKPTAIVLLTVGAFVAGTLIKRQQPAGSPGAASSKQVLFWACPMHPQYKSDHPGDAPCCGMRLQPVYATSGGAERDSSVPGQVHVSAAKQQLIGVRSEVVERRAASHVLRIPARIAVDETRLYRLVAATDGWVKELGRNQAGAFVTKGEVLVSYFVPDLVETQQNYLYALQTNAQFQANVPVRYGLTLRQSLDALRGLGMTEVQIEELQRSRNPLSELRAYAPLSGFVLARNLSPWQRFDKGTELYRIADISHVWVMADIFERDRRFLTPGATATIRYDGLEFRARMSRDLPQLDPQTRTLKTRFEMDNPGYVLRPDVFVDLELAVRMPPGVTVPADAVIDTGRRKTVYVERDGGTFEPRVVETGWRLGDRVEIPKGLEPGERIVVAGNFLIDSESRMNTAAVSTASIVAGAAAEKDPVCGMDVDSKAPKAIKAQHDGKTYYFCSGDCKRTFEANPGKYAAKRRGTV